MNRKIYQFIPLLFVVFVSNFAFGQSQGNKADFCGKKWYLEKIQEATGEIYPADKAQQKEYMLYNCDGSFESIESGLNIKGKWIYNPSGKTVIVTQTQTKNYPSKVVTTIKSSTSTSLVLQGKDAGGELLTMYLKAK